MRSSFFSACVIALASVAVTAPARATAIFPAEIVKHLGLTGDKTPACTLCHSSLAGGFGTVTSLFGKQGLARGLQDADTASLDTYLDASAAEMTDSDKDGVTDIDELKAGTDPNTAPGGAVALIPEYGCAASPAPASGAGGLAGLLVAAGLVASRRRRRAG